MKPVRATAAALSLAFAAPASATLAVSAQAPDFTTRGAQGGTLMTVHLAELLKKGPVVLYFFPAAFTGGCTEEAHKFAEAIDRFQAAGATVLGMSADPVATLADFSTQECSSKFPLASAGPGIVSGFDVAYVGSPLTSRTSYVIAPSGRIAYVHADEDYVDHVKNTLEFVQKMKSGG
jgi:peroxiredoxin